MYSKKLSKGESNMSDCTPEFWTLKEIRDSLEKEWNGKKKIVIPMFQRGKRWDKDKKETFIDSLRKRYPIGTLLFYKTVEGAQEIYTLIDGLQRGTAIKEYLSSPSKFFKINEISEESLNKIYNLLLSSGNENTQKEKINSLICDYIHGLKNYDDLELLELYNIISSDFPILKDKSKDFCNALKDDFKMLKEDYNSLCSMSIPAIVYTGDENTLPEIFERINSKGVALTEYEIYAASWPRQEFVISNENIVDYVLKKYDLLNDSEYSIGGYDRDKKRKSKKVNAFEYVFGLSKYLQNKYNSLGFYKNKSDDETNPVAFQILNACFNTSHKQIKSVHEIITRFSSKIEVLENALITVIEFVNKCIDPILKFKGNNRKDEGKIFHSQYQIMSLISFTFRKKYNIDDDDLKIKDTWKESKQKLQEQIWKYYIFDILTQYWGEGGTGKIHSANSDNRYFIPLTEVQFATAYDSYTEGQFNRHEARQVPNPSDIDYVILNTIYLSSFSAMDQLSIDKFDVEHIATKDQMKSLIKKTNGWGLPISHLANLCYLPEFENRSKGSSNFYQDDNYLQKADSTIEVIERKYSFTKKEDLEFMDLPYGDKDFDVLQEYYVNDFLKNRNKCIKAKFLTALGFSEDKSYEKETEPREIKEQLFDDKFFRITKIGKMVRTSFLYLSENNLLSDDDIFNLRDRDYCRKHLGCAFPVLTNKKEDTIDSNGVSRYYQDQVSLKEVNYYLCKEWFENDRKYVGPWLESRIIKKE